MVFESTLERKNAPCEGVNANPFTTTRKTDNAASKRICVDSVVSMSIFVVAMAISVARHCKWIVSSATGGGGGAAEIGEQTMTDSFRRTLSISYSAMIRVVASSIRF